MRYLLYNGNSLNTILFILSRYGYTLNYPKVSISLLLSGHPYKILIDTDKRSYYVVTYNQNIHYLTGDSDIFCSDDDNTILKELGINDIEENKLALYSDIILKSEKNLLKLLESPELKSNDISIIDQFEKILGKEKNKVEDNKVDSNLNNDFKSEFLPGRIVQLIVKDQEYFGFIISSKAIVYVNNKGEIKGYLSGCFNSPKNGSFYQVKKIFVPTPHCFKLSDYTKMDVAWPKIKNKVVKKTIAEVEKELGLEPGTLEIQ